MEGSSPLECGVCNENFDDKDKCPRILPCYHHICTCCIQHLIDNNQKTCPFCRKSFDAQSAKDVRINTGVLDLVNYIAFQVTHVDSEEIENKAESGDGSTNIGSVYATENASNSILRKCREFEGLIDQSVKKMGDLTTSLTIQNDVISADILNHFNEIVSKNDSNAEELKDREERILEYRKTLKEKEEELKILKQRLRTSEDKFTEDDDIRKEVEELNTSIGVWIAGLKEILHQDMETREKIEEEVRMTTRLADAVQETIKSVNADEELEEAALPTPTAPPMNFPEKHIDPPPVVYPEQSQAVSCSGMNSMMANMHISEYPSSLVRASTVLGNMTSIMMKNIKSGLVFAVQHDRGPQRFAKLSLLHENLHLHALRYDPPPSESTLIDINELLPHCKPIAFLELRKYGRYDGRIYIDLSPVSLGGQNFVQMCTGEKGPSYVNTALLSVQAKGTRREAIQGGDYEHNNGSGGKTVITGLDLSGHMYKRKWEAGVVRGASYHLFSQFYINTQTEHGTFCNGAIGKVTSGLSNLRGYIKECDHISSITIRDCGTILKCGYIPRC